MIKSWNIVAIKWIYRYFKWDYWRPKWSAAPRAPFTPSTSGSDSRALAPPFRAASTPPLLLLLMLLPSLNAELTLDPKGRVMLPRPLRAALELQGINRLVAFANAGPTGGLALSRVDAFEAMAADHQSGGPLDARSRLFALAIASTAHTLTIDSNGRLNLPSALCELLELERELYLYTAGTWFEIWNRARWKEHAFRQAAGVWDELNGFDSLTRPAAANGEEA